MTRLRSERKKRFFPRKTRKEAEVLTARTPFGMTCFCLVLEAGVSSVLSVPSVLNSPISGFPLLP